jgi:hypothetical protein
MATVDREQGTRIAMLLPDLERRFHDDDTSYVMPLGDNWLHAWEWAKQCEREHGLDHQACLRAAHDQFFAPRTHRGGRDG